jgi:3-hydroxyisobutyrate dehydrogenase-like beta-hydroxyacid dehydrogenase
LVADAAAGREGWTYVDANAIAPGTAAVVAGLVEGGGGAYIDGGIIGPPPLKAGTTRLYLSGPAAIGLSATIATTEMEIHVVDDSPYAASALKLSYAAWTKGSAALLLSAWAAATRSGVDTALLEEWRTSRPGLPAELSAARLSSAAKGWRWAAEMEEIATMFDSLGLPPGFHQAAATVFSDPT